MRIYKHKPVTVRCVVSTDGFSLRWDAPHTAGSTKPTRDALEHERRAEAVYAKLQADGERICYLGPLFSPDLKCPDGAHRAPFSGSGECHKDGCDCMLCKGF